LAGDGKKWQGEWNGRFGRGLVKAHLETFYVANDGQDLEYIVKVNSDNNELRDGEELRYYPRPGVLIGDKNPNVTRQNGLPWGGMGLRIAVRGYQWDNPEARDILFWEYAITNISEYDLPTCGFGYFIDNSIGGDTGGDQESAWFDDLLDLSFAWEGLGVGVGGRPTGVSGLAYLENPGKPTDMVDNDMDGLIDEKRDNPDAGALIGPYDGIDNLENFLSFYNLKEEDLHDHYEGDEDQDWIAGVDLNGNGTYARFNEDLNEWELEPGETAGNDVGLDGVGPGDLNYTGPDEGECNGKPDWVEGVGCEPNYNATDVSESDMIGLTSFQIFDWQQWHGWNLELGQDRPMWEAMDQPLEERQVYDGTAGSLYEIFASTRFAFPRGRTERISMAQLFTFDTQSTLDQSPPQAPKMFRLKQTAQLIYERDYQFATPPLTPTLTATASDGKVILSWDNLADKKTREPFLANENDFEGYKVYKATDKTFQDATIITDGAGDASTKAPIFQCDLKNNRTGYAEYGVHEGTAFYLGEDTGIRHYYIDNNVKNGVTYYYAVVAYDYGIEELGLSPAGSNVVIELGESEEIVRIGKNVVYVTPGAKAAGYVASDISIDEDRSTPELLDGMITPRIADANLLKQGHDYMFAFTADTLDYARNERFRSPYDAQLVTTGFEVRDVTDGNRLVYYENPNSYIEDNLISTFEETKAGDIINEVWRFNEQPFLTDIFDGVQLQLDLGSVGGTTEGYPQLNYSKSGWVTGYSPMNLVTGAETNFFLYDYEIVFTGDPIAYTTRTVRTTSITDTSGTAISRAYLILDNSFDFYVINKSVIDTTGDYYKCDLIVHDLNESGAYEWNEDVVLVGYTQVYRTRMYWSGTAFTLDWRGYDDASYYPIAGDVFRASFDKPWSSSEKLYFTVNPAQELDESQLKSAMNEIRVVPNPYIATNIMETAVLNKRLNQRRQIMFTNIPAQCIIRIFTSSGLLVDEILVENDPADGIVKWDLKSREDLEIAAGMYFYHVKSDVTGDEKVGKFAVIK
ncbi:MAG: hypothetical protein DWQ10_12505, partial [Calditrichaeota bacterium]